MGQSCCKKGNDESKDLDFDKSKQPTKLDPALNDLMDHASKNEEKVVKI